MATFGSLWQHFATEGHLWQLFAAYGKLWQSLATDGKFWQLMATTPFSVKKFPLTSWENLVCKAPKGTPLTEFF